MNTIFFPISELPEMLRISRAMIYAEIRAGRLRTTKIGARTLVHRDDLDSYVKALRMDGRH